MTKVCRPWSPVVVLIVALLASPTADAQEILLDERVEAGELICFRDFKDEKRYYYLPDEPRIAAKDGKPQFSFLKYVQNVETAGEGGTTRGQGGGIVHFLANYEISDEVRQEAEQELRRQVPGATLAGPVMYRDGTFSLVSGFTDPESGLTRKVYGIGKAPVLEGHKAAISMHLTREGATLLWESFKTATPDLSIQFEMQAAGYRNPVEAKLVADFAKIYQHQSLNVGAKVHWIGADIRAMFDELRDTGAITLTFKGESDMFDKLLTTAYGKILDRIFEKDTSQAALKGIQADQQPFSNFDKTVKFYDKEQKARKRRARSKTTKKTAKPAKGGKPASKPKKATPAQRGARPGRPSSFALLASYRLKKVRQTGFLRVNFRQYLSDRISFPMSENVGDLHTQHGDDPTVFREVNLDDPVYQQREVLVSLDGQDVQDFTKYVNYVTVKLRKTHEDGSLTHDEVKIDKNNFSESANLFRLMYGWKGDRQRSEWLEYEYKVTWSFFGGALHEGEWQTGDDFMITVAPPHRYRSILLSADAETLGEQKVRAATVKFFHDMFGREAVQSVMLPTKDGSYTTAIEYSHPADNLDYEYEITWRIRGGEQVSSGRRTDSAEMIFCDELPR
jgi:hypothetical protein